MRPYRLIVAIFLPLATCGWQRVLAEDGDPPSWAHPLGQPRVLPPGNWGLEQRQRLAGLPQQAPGQPEAPEPDTPPLPGQPRPAAALTLEDLEQMALESNPTLVQARMAVQAAEGKSVQAGLYPNPRVGYVADEIGNEGHVGFQGAFVRQELVTAGKLALGRAAAGHEVQQARYGWEVQRWRVLNDVRAGYYEVLLAQKMIELNEQLVRVGQEGVKATEKLRAALEVSRSPLLQARIQADTAGLGLTKARNHHRAAWRRLAAVIGRPRTEPAPLAGDVTENLPELTFEATLDQLLAQSPELAQARAGVERARCKLAHEYALRVPNVEVGAAVKYDTNSQFTVADVEVGLPLRLFDRNQGNISRAQAELIAASHEVRRVELALHNRLAAAFEQYANARRQVDVYRAKILLDAEESLKLVSDNYPEFFGYIELLTAQRTFFTVNLDYLSNLKGLWDRSVELEGMLLRGGLEPGLHAARFGDE